MAARTTTRDAKPARRRGARVRKAPVPSSQDDAEMVRLLRHWRDAVPDDRLAHLVKDATRALIRALQSRLAAYGVPFGHWAYLRVLWERDGLTQRELSQEVGVMEPTTFSALKAMESRGYVTRRHLAGNRRNVHAFLTAKGRSLKVRLVPLAEEVNRIAVAGVPGRDVRSTRRTLLAVLENLACEQHGADATAKPVRDSRRRRGRAAD